VEHPAFYLVLGFTAAAVLAGWGYFRRFRLARPPIGVITLGDVAVMIGATVVVPYLYLGLPLWLVAGLFALGVLGVLYTMGEPVIRARWAIWLVALMLLGADIGTNVRFGATHLPFLLVNNLVLTLVIVGVANLWAQSGTKARDVAVLAGALAVYDLIATSFLPVTTDLFHHLADMPLTPMLAWGSGSDRLGIGLGDVLLAIAVLSTVLELLDVRVAIPVMAVLGPLMILQYCYWMWRQGSERTTWQYVAAESCEQEKAVAHRTDFEVQPVSFGQDNW
jgi:hypothetical protein